MTRALAVEGSASTGIDDVSTGAGDGGSGGEAGGRATCSGTWLGAGEGPSVLHACHPRMAAPTPTRARTPSFVLEPGARRLARVVAECAAAA